VGADEGQWFKITSSAKVAREALVWSVARSGGPGGQHANTSDTKVEVRVDVRTAEGLGPRQRARLLEQLGPIVRAVASDTRSQHRNRELALERLRSRLAAGLRTPRPRHATAPSAAAQERRLEGKHRRADTKRARRPPEPED
jgi:ribosome-associated protein